MKPPPFHLCLLAILLHTVFASTSLSGEIAALSLSKKPRPKTKPIVGMLVRKGKPQDKHGKANILPKKSGLTLLIDLLPKALVEIVIGYFKNDAYYSILVSAHSWLLKARPQIAVDSARLYVMVHSENIKDVKHASANLKENDCHCIELDDPQWSTYYGFTSSHDGRYVSIRHSYQASTGLGRQTKFGTKWFTQGSEPAGGAFKRVAFDGEDSSYGVLSRDGHRLFSYSAMTNVTRVYQIMEEAGKDPTASTKFELNGYARAVSGDGNRVIVQNAEQLEIHDIGRGASELLCRIDASVLFYNCALNQDGSEAAFFSNGELRIVQVAVGDNADQPATVTVKVPEPLGGIYQLSYSDGDKLHVLHYGGKVSLFDPSTKTLIRIEDPEEGQEIIDLAISPNADYIAILQCVEKERSKKTIYRAIVKRKSTKNDWRDLFGYETDKVASNPGQAKRPSDRGQ